MMNVYVAECLARERIADALATAEHRRLASLASPRPSFRVTLGGALIRVGHVVAGTALPEGSVAGPMDRLRTPLHGAR